MTSKTAGTRQDDRDDLARRVGMHLRACYRSGESGDYERAEVEATAAIRLDPETSDAYYLRGHALYCRGEYERAVADYTETPLPFLTLLASLPDVTSTSGTSPHPGRLPRA